VVGRNGDRLEGRCTAIMGKRLKLAVKPSSKAGSPRIGAHANEVHVPNLSRCYESEEIRCHASAPVAHYESRLTKLVNEHRMMPGAHIALPPVLAKRVDDRV
jgi:hypothetical protein